MSNPKRGLPLDYVKVSKNQYRIIFSLIIVTSAIFLVGANYAAASEDPYAEFQEQAALPSEERTELAPPRDGITVVTSHSGSPGNIVAVNPDGTLLYHNDTYDGYWDVDPSPEGDYSVVYAATGRVPNSNEDCNPIPQRNEHCIRQLIERANLRTGETTVLYSRIDPVYERSQWHDVDRIDENHYIVADMYSDEVFIINVSSGIVVWEWSAQNHFPLSSGGPYPSDWVHLNDVEMLHDGRIMASLRNQDQVVFIDRQEGVIDDWTLGADDDYSILYEQHNPDYIPESNGGPAVLVADSEHNRVVEYQRTPGDEWEQTWQWQDLQVQWPRDADRLPNGHTLISDTHGGRVVEVDRQGEIVWKLDVPGPYESERLNTGDESLNGPSATEADLEARTSSELSTTEGTNTVTRVRSVIKGLFPTKVVNGISSFTPFWFGIFDLGAVVLGILTALAWLGLEVWWADIRLRSPIVRK